MNVSKAKTATIMNKFTIQQLQQMRESEDRVEFKAGEGGGRHVIGMHDNYPHRVTGTRQAQDAIGQLEADIYRDTTIRPEIYELYDEENRRVLVIEVPSRPIGKVFKFEDVPLMRVGEELKPMSDAMYLKILQESEPDFSEKICEGLSLEDLDEEAIRVYRVSRGESIRNVDSVTLKKLLSQELLIETSDGIKLTPLYDEMKLRAGVTDKKESSDVRVNVPVNDTVKLSQLTERQKRIYHIIKDGTINDTANDIVNDTVTAKTLSEALGASIITIKRDIAAMQSVGVIKRVGSDKTGHWEAIVK